MTLREERLTQRITLREYCLLHNLDIVQRSREERAEYSADDIVDKLPAICSSMSDADAQSMIKMLEAEEAEVQKIRDAKAKE